MLLILAGLVGVFQPTSASHGKFVNLSTRALVERGEEVMIGGFVIEDGAVQILIQAVGPELTNDGISNVLVDPVLTVTNTTDTGNPIEIMVNDNWEDSQGQLISDLWGGNPRLTPGSLSAGAVLTLEPGSYTAKVEGKDETVGVAIVEVYVIDSPGSDGRLVNLSTRALVERGEEVMIGGFIIEDGLRQVLIQAVGPELANHGISNTLVDPYLTVTNTTDPDNPIEILFNDDWEDSHQQLVSDFWGGSPRLTAGSQSSAVVLTLGPGKYTAKVSGDHRPPGVALVEIYGIDSPATGSADLVTLVALAALYNMAGGPNWANTINWLTDAPPGDWYGVTTDEAGRVIGLDFRENNLFGRIPAELGNLANLQNLRLAHNWLSGPIPPELGNLTNLERLDLSSDRLNGPIPPELGNLTKLEWLSLGINELSEPIPPELFNLANLKYLDLHHNRLSGPIPPELGNLANLESLNLRQNLLSGPIPPELGNLANLENLDLRNNKLTRPIPGELFNLANLQYLDLSQNPLSGPIPPELANLANLRGLELDGNDLSGPIPPELGNFPNLLSLSLTHNRLSGSIPPELANLANLRGLALNNNDLSGSIPPEFGNFDDLLSLSLGHNRLSGPIPPELGNLANLEWLSLDNNDLSGPLPAELGNLDNLGRLSLYNNQLIGCIPRGLLRDVGELYPLTLGPFCGPRVPNWESIHLGRCGAVVHPMGGYQ